MFECMLCAEYTCNQSLIAKLLYGIERMLMIPWTDKVTNEGVLRRVGLKSELM